MQDLRRGHEATRLFNSTVRMYNRAPVEAKKKYKRQLLHARKAIVISKEAEEWFGNPAVNEWRGNGRENFTEMGLGIYQEAVALANMICNPIHEELTEMGILQPKQVCGVGNVRLVESGDRVEDGDSPATSIFENSIILDLFDDRFWSSSSCRI